MGIFAALGTQLGHVCAMEDRLTIQHAHWPLYIPAAAAARLAEGDDAIAAAEALNWQELHVQPSLGEHTNASSCSAYVQNNCCGGGGL